MARGGNDIWDKNLGEKGQHFREWGKKVSHLRGRPKRERGRTKIVIPLDKAIGLGPIRPIIKPPKEKQKK